MAKLTRKQRRNALIKEKIRELIRLRRSNVLESNDNLSKYMAYFNFFIVKEYLSLNKNKDINKAIKELKSKIK